MILVWSCWTGGGDQPLSSYNPSVSVFVGKYFGSYVCFTRSGELRGSSFGGKLQTVELSVN